MQQCITPHYTNYGLIEEFEKKSILKDKKDMGNHHEDNNAFEKMLLTMLNK